MQRQGRGVAGRANGRAESPAPTLGPTLGPDTGATAAARTAGCHAAAPTPDAAGWRRVRLPGRRAARPRHLGVSRGRGGAVWCRDPRGAAGQGSSLAARLCGRPWRGGSACLSSPGMLRSISPMQRAGRQPRSACRRASPGGRAACWRRRMWRPRLPGHPGGGAAGAGRRRCAGAAACSIDAALEARARPERIERAARGLLRRQPASSAAPGRDLAADGRLGLASAF